MKKFLIVLVAILSLSFVGCDTMNKQQDKKEENLVTLFEMVPTPVVKTGQERKLVAKRVTTFDVENKLGYVYLFLDGNSTPLGYYTVFGKVASLNSFLVPQQRISQGGSSVLDDADLDGTYGHNIEGVFFFTDTNAYVEWNGKYLYSDQPLPIKVPHLNVKE